MEGTSRIIYNGPDDLRLVCALATRQPTAFWISVGESGGTNDPEQMNCHVEGIERGSAPYEYHLAVQMIGLKTPQWQYFKYNTLTYRGEWVGCLNIGHKAYEGHSFRME